MNKQDLILSNISSFHFETDKNDLINYKIPYRLKLGLPNYVTFGLEIECEHVDYKKIANYIAALNDTLNFSWNSDTDASLDVGIEVKSPVLTDNVQDWNNIKRICAFLYRNALIYEQAAGHIHIGSQILQDKKEYWYNFLLLWSVYEDIFYRFLYGEYLTPRKNIDFYAHPIARILIGYIERFDEFSLRDIIEDIGHERNLGVNFKKVKTRYLVEGNLNCIKDSTIEFRCPNGTLNPIIWQNNVNLITKSMLYCSSDNFDRDYFHRLNNDKIKNDDYNYRKQCFYRFINFQGAVDLCERIFDNNVDKINFYKQYFKDYVYTLKDFEEGPRLTRFKKD